MWRLYLIISHPLTWLVLLLITTVILFYSKYTKFAILILIILVVFSLSLTAKGSEVWMDSVAKVTNVEGLKCDNTQTKAAILLPGGIVWMRDGSRVMTPWSAVRVKAVSDDIKKGKISQIFIPGGYTSGELSEGLRLKVEIKKRLTKNTIEKIDIQVGSGSESTYGNFSELAPLLDRNMTHRLYTSDWHMYRAFKVARRQGINVCPVMINNPHDQKSLFASSWKLKAAVREYIAIIWYAIKDRI